MMNTRRNVLMMAVFIVVVTVMLSIPMVAPGQTLAVPVPVDGAGCCRMGTD
jgi:hypothetical protein